MRADDERGAATAFVATAVTALVLIAVVVAEIAGLVAVRHRATAAADLAALAGSRASLAGSDGCEAARAAARRNGAALTACRMDYDVATVTARATSERWWGHRWAFAIEARAAPDFYLDSQPGRMLRDSPTFMP